MDGCKLVAISGIDGCFDEFNKTIEVLLNKKDCIKISYNRSISFIQNIKEMRIVINDINENVIVIGWSIGAVAAAFLANCQNIKSVILINAFFSRYEILKRRNIACDEEVTIYETSKQSVNYIIIAGRLDNKIPYTESKKIAHYYKIEPDRLLIFDEAKHNLSSFPKGIIANMINNNML